MASGSGPILTNLFAATLAYNLKSATARQSNLTSDSEEPDDFVTTEDVIGEHIRSSCGYDESKIVGVVVLFQGELIFAHNSPTFIYGFKKSKSSNPVVTVSKCKNHHDPTFQNFRLN